MKAIIRLRSEALNKEGRAPLQLVASMGRAGRAMIGIGLSAAPDELDRNCMFKPRAKNAADSNLILQKALARANDIFVRARLAGRAISPDQFKAEWKAPGGGADFLEFWDTELHRQLSLEIIGYSTFAQHKSALKKWRLFRPTGLRFVELTPEMLELFKVWHGRRLAKNSRAHKKGRSAQVKAMKSTRKFLYAARKMGIYQGPNPFEHVKVGRTPQRVVYLDQEELRRLWLLYEDGEYKEALRPFLFCCYCGLRLSDVSALQDENLQGGALRITMVKGSRTNPQALFLPLPAIALRLIAQGGLPMVRTSEQHLRRMLKRACADAGIKKQVTFHASRHTFGVQFLEAGGALEVLQRLMGHSKVATTMVYVHVSEQRRRDQAALLDKLPSASYQHAGGQRAGRKQESGGSSARGRKGAGELATD